MVTVIKGLIENEGRVLIVKRSLVDEVGAGSWETEGGNFTSEKNWKRL